MTRLKTIQRFWLLNLLAYAVFVLARWLYTRGRPNPVAPAGGKFALTGI